MATSTFFRFLIRFEELINDRKVIEVVIEVTSALTFKLHIEIANLTTDHPISIDSTKYQLDLSITVYISNTRNELKIDEI